MAMFGRLTGYSREAYLWIRAVPKGMALNCICKAPGIIHRGSVRERMETKTVIKAVVSLVPIGRGQRELMKPLFQLNVKSYSDLPKATEEENGKAKNLTWMIVNYTENSKWDPSKQLYRTKSQSSYLNIDLVHVEPALSLRQYCYVNVRRLHVQSALRALNDRMTVDFEERSKHKLQSSDLNREVVEPIVQRQVEDALKIQDPVLRRDILVNLILVEKQNFAIANQQLGTVSEQKDTANEALSLEQIRRVMETFEFDNFPHPWDLNYSARKVTFDHAKLNALTGDDKKQEIRFQKMRFYLSNNPNQALQNLVKMLKSLNISIDEFALGYAKAYRDISERIHRLIIKPKPIDPYDFFLEQSAIDATIILMKACGINKRLIELFSKLQKK